jgi:hypothetical protein
VQFFFHFQNKQKNFAAYNEMTISENILLKSVDNLIRLVIRTIFLNAVLTFLFFYKYKSRVRALITLESSLRILLRTLKFFYYPFLSVPLSDIKGEG